MNKILEAIQRGIQMGLEIQDDELDQSIFQKTEVTSDYHTDRAEQIRFIRDNFVDLGLPSGTLWCKYNIGATCRKSAISWYGCYYAWGETEEKDTYDWKSYKFCDGAFDNTTKYNCSASYGEVDNKTTLDLEDDVAHVKMGHGCTMPSKEDLEELCNLPYEWVINYNGVIGLDGRQIIGNNGNTLFIPAAGYCNVAKTSVIGFRCYLWTNSLCTDNSSHAYNAYFGSGVLGKNYDSSRCIGMAVRAVIHK